ncbi:glutathione hydrolase 5 proenzyme isoform X2 [Dendropsophus ebraccatus]|uniref:glutathione hydrolase 5 proenzyme isoform X2 n=1 Tax=Dendropsophus ebraccatus TaxID=150705 RepID=UPI003831347F
MAISKRLCYALIIVLFVAIVAIILSVYLLGGSSCDGGFTHGAVAADSEICSNIGRDILKQGGSAVDAAIAALLCTSVIYPQSMGIGGGVIFTIYNASTGNVEVINARETVPKKFLPNLMAQCAGTTILKPGQQWIGVPGELKGYEAAHKRYGRLPWKDLFQPTIQLVTEGVNVSNVLYKFINVTSRLIEAHSVCNLLCKDKKVLKPGDPLNFIQLAHTLQTVADEGADSFYKGSIAKRMVEDLNDQGSSLTLEDLENYKVQILSPLNVPLGNYKLYTAPPPAGGALLTFVLKILEGFHFNKNAMHTVSKQIETYHRIAEALKFANGNRDKLTNPVTSADIAEFIDTWFSNDFTKEIRSKIDNFGDHDFQFYNLSTVTKKETFGTTHVSVISSDGSSVSATSSINHVFGSMIYSSSTGIILNNQLADFCNVHMVSLKEGMQPPSSMTPAILLSKDKKSQLVIGGSGGLRIISATAQTVREGLKDKRHNISEAKFALNVVQGVYKEKSCLFPYSDGRKLGKSAGY